MEHMVQLHIEHLPEGVYLATSDDIQGLVAQGRTIAETIEIARDVAKKLIEAQTGDVHATLHPVLESFDYKMIVAT
jgi:predicted RNase H-like HicB family nuclease